MKKQVRIGSKVKSAQAMFSSRTMAFVQMPDPDKAGISVEADVTQLENVLAVLRRQCSRLLATTGQKYTNDKSRALLVELQEVSAAAMSNIISDRARASINTLSFLGR